MESAFQYKKPYLQKVDYLINKEFDPKGKSSVEIQVNMSVELNKDSELSEATVALHVEIGEKDERSPYYIAVTEEARFKWDSGLTEEQIDRLLNQNAPTLLLSYIRPLVSQVTASSPYGAYDIPFMNFTDRR